MSKEAIFLSRRKAEDLLLNELHINYRLDLIKDFPNAPPDAMIYRLKLGHADIIIQNDWIDHNGLISVLIHFAGYKIKAYYDPDNLQERILETIRYQRMKRKYLSENPCKFDGDFDEYYIQINNKE